MNFIERDDDQSLLNPGIFELRQKTKQGQKIRQFIDWNGMIGQHQEAPVVQYSVGFFIVLTSLHWF